MSLPLAPSRDAGAAWQDAMRRGDFPAAWAVSDAVLAARHPAASDDPAQPYHLRWIWDGRPLDGRRVLVRCYHGLGDTLQFARYLAPLRSRAGALTVEAQPELVPLLHALPGPDQVRRTAWFDVHPFDPARPLPPDEATVEIMELAHALRLAPPAPPYFDLPSGAAPRNGHGLRVGLCWAAGAWLPQRSVPLAALAPLERLPGVQLVSLQHGPAAADAPAGLFQARLNPGLASLGLNPAATVEDTVRLLARVDLVLTVDTMIAHLAGALGRPTWLLLKADPDWRWGGGRSPWYPGIRQFRQTVAGDWSGPVTAVAAALAAHPGLPGGRAAL